MYYKKELNKANILGLNCSGGHDFLKKLEMAKDGYLSVDILEIFTMLI